VSRSRDAPAPAPAASSRGRVKDVRRVFGHVTGEFWEGELRSARSAPRTADEEGEEAWTPRKAVRRSSTSRPTGESAKVVIDAQVAAPRRLVFGRVDEAGYSVPPLAASATKRPGRCRCAGSIWKVGAARGATSGTGPAAGRWECEASTREISSPGPIALSSPSRWTDGEDDFARRGPTDLFPPTPPSTRSPSSRRRAVTTMTLRLPLPEPRNPRTARARDGHGEGGGRHGASIVSRRWSAPRRRGAGVVIREDRLSPCYRSST